jgi:hypothetical protein
MKPNIILITTIGNGEIFTALAATLSEEEKLVTDVIVIPDRKTPMSCWQNAREARLNGLSVLWKCLGEQATFLSAIRCPLEIPFDTDYRRNIGLLMAYADPRVQRVIMMDDDNFPIGPDFIVGHAVVGRRDVAVEGVAGLPNEWFNMLVHSDADERLVYPRGFPFGARGKPSTVWVGSGKVDARIAAHVGYWIGDPDIDGVTRSVLHPRVLEWNPDRFVLCSDSRMPINSQNTCVVRDAIPAYWYVKMGAPILGTRIDRYGDIFSGYFLQMAAQAVGEAITMGAPIVDHRRNAHDILHDALIELPAAMVLEQMTEFIMTPLTSTNYVSAAFELADRLVAVSFRGKLSATREAITFLQATAHDLRLWAGLCQRLA